MPVTLWTLIVWSTLTLLIGFLGGWFSKRFTLPTGVCRETGKLEAKGKCSTHGDGAGCGEPVETLIRDYYKRLHEMIAERDRFRAKVARSYKKETK